MTTPERWKQVKELLGTALEMDPTHRSTFLDQACGNDLSLRNEVERLLRAEAKAGASFLHESAQLGTLLGTEPDDPRIGQVLGSYKLISAIGEGGMGAVYRGIRADDQYERRVAVKQPPIDHS